MYRLEETLILIQPMATSIPIVFSHFFFVLKITVTVVVRFSVFVICQKSFHTYHYYYKHWFGNHAPFSRI